MKNLQRYKKIREEMAALNKELQKIESSWTVAGVYKIGRIHKNQTRLLERLGMAKIREHWSEYYECPVDVYGTDNPTAVLKKVIKHWRI
jgi:hypothetical protein